MNFFPLMLIALAMSTDAFAVAICKGVAMKTPKFSDAIKVGVLFGFIEAITPILGWLLGYVAVQYIAQWDHWVILGLMLFLGSRMIVNGREQTENPCDDSHIKSESIFMLILTAISTSIDAFAVGISLAFASVNIGVAALCIGLATCMMVTIGILLGKSLGALIGKRAEILGGIVLILIGVFTFLTH
jgi:manganese efflux pump family protein